MNIILGLLDYLSIAIAAVFLLFLLKKKVKKRQDFFLLILIALIIAGIWVEQMDYAFLSATIFYSISNLIQIAIGVMSLFYLEALLRPSKKHQVLLHAIIPLINVAVLLISLGLGWDDDTYYESVLFFIQLFANFIAVVLYGILCLMIYSKSNWAKRGKPTKKIEWARVLVVNYFIYAFFSFSYFLIYAIADDNQWIWLIECLVTVGILSILLQKGFQLGIISLRETAEDLNKEDQWENLFKKLDLEIRTKGLFKNPLLKIDDLAQLMSTNVKYISSAVNSIYGNSVTNYLNDLRLDLFKSELLNRNNEILTIDAIATNCGFNSKSSANRYFKIKEGVTPSEYRSQHRN